MLLGDRWRARKRLPVWPSRVCVYRASVLENKLTHLACQVTGWVYRERLQGTNCAWRARHVRIIIDPFHCSPLNVCRAIVLATLSRVNRMLTDGLVACVRVGHASMITPSPCHYISVLQGGPEEMHKVLHIWWLLKIYKNRFIISLMRLFTAILLRTHKVRCIVDDILIDQWQNDGSDVSVYTILTYNSFMHWHCWTWNSILFVL